MVSFGLLSSLFLRRIDFGMILAVCIFVCCLLHIQKMLCYHVIMVSFSISLHLRWIPFLFFFGPEMGNALLWEIFLVFSQPCHMDYSLVGLIF